MENLTQYQQGYLDGLKAENGFDNEEYDENTIDAILGKLVTVEWEQDNYRVGYADAIVSPVAALTLNAENKITL